MAIPSLNPERNITSIVFIDGSLADLQTILSGLAPSVTAIQLDPTQDGIQQMADTLAGVFASSQAPAWELSVGSSSFQYAKL